MSFESNVTKPHTYTFERGASDKKLQEEYKATENKYISKPSFVSAPGKSPARPHTYEFISKPSFVNKSPVRDANTIGSAQRSGKFDDFKRKLDEEMSQRKVVSAFGASR